MSFFTSGMFWFFEGICFCLAGVALKHYLQDRGIPMRWWKWVLFTLWVILFGFTIAFVGTSIGENETTAATLGGLVFGVASIITGVGIWRMLRVGGKKKVVTTGENI